MKVGDGELSRVVGEQEDVKSETAVLKDDL